MANGVFNSYSKSYGQIYIQDDRFFSQVAMATGFANCLSRILWGKVYDSLGFKVRKQYLLKEILNIL